ncbi:hypothetical protein ElyMa_003596800 [Elysia marginata]|uniref:C-type lectin domain-containing protein n=1 Tax=Elysia marginata TaxID=1093978 RepID=A0AAV4ERP8_9GAST|nr:hypothetical protein ElyMa_003596800 [Elysia marginata]
MWRVVLSCLITSLPGAVADIQDDSSAQAKALELIQDRIETLSSSASSMGRELDQLTYEIKRDIYMRRNYHVSHYERDKFYIASKFSDKFIQKEFNNNCRGFGGFLAEINSRADHLMVREFVKSIRPRGPWSFYTGGIYSSIDRAWFHYDSGEEARFIKHIDFTKPEFHGYCLTYHFDGTTTHSKCKSIGAYICEIPVSRGSR